MLKKRIAVLFAVLAVTAGVAGGASSTAAAKGRSFTPLGLSDGAE